MKLLQSLYLLTWDNHCYLNKISYFNSLSIAIVIYFCSNKHLNTSFYLWFGDNYYGLFSIMHWYVFGIIISFNIDIIFPKEQRK